MDIGDKIKQIISDSIDMKHFEVKDFTGRHLNHEQHNGGFHLEATIVSDHFVNKSLIDRHKIVYASLENEKDRKSIRISIEKKIEKDFERKMEIELYFLFAN